MGIYQSVQQFVSIKKKTIFFQLNINNFNEEKKIYTCTCTSNKYTCIFIKVHVH